MIGLSPTEISELIQEKIKNFDNPIKTKNEGKIISVSDGIIHLNGLNEVAAGEMISLPNNTYGLVLNLETDSVGAVVLGNYEHLREGDIAYSTGKILEVPVGNELLGRVINTLGIPIDGKGKINSTYTGPLEQSAPGVIWRESVNEPLQTGIKAIDSMIPIGLGQRELIIGDRQTGKTSIALDTIINQKNKNIKCIYVAIGQKSSSVAEVVQKLEEYDALSNTIIVAANASDAASLQYLAPYAGCAIGEFFRDSGENALIVYDDLTKQAWAYRQISLLLRRPPGREAYPGDIFYLHSRLLERAAKVNNKYLKKKKVNSTLTKNVTGSLTAIPIIETQAGDISSFVPTNVISITDGQIFLETNLFNSGIRPAINVGNSVSRVGGSAQTNIMKKLGSNVRLSLAQYRELESFSQFASDLDKNTIKQLKKGQILIELMKQKQFSTLNIAQIALSLYAVEYGFFNNIEITKITTIEYDLHQYFINKYPVLMKNINLLGEFNEKISNDFTNLLEDFKHTYSH